MFMIASMSSGSCKDDGRPWKSEFHAGSSEAHEHHGELTPFGIRWRGDDWWSLTLNWRNVRCGRKRHGRCGGRCAGHPTGPDEYTAVFIHRQLFGVDEIIFEVFQSVVIELQSALEHPIGDALLPLEECNDLGQDSIVVHQRSSTCASA